MEYIQWETEAVPWNELYILYTEKMEASFVFLIIPYIFCPLNLFRSII